MKKFLYEFNGTILLEAKNHSKASKLLDGIPVEDYIVNEQLFETDEYYLSSDTKTREAQVGTYHHPIHSPVKFENYKIKECRYSEIFRRFLNGTINKEQLIKLTNAVDDTNEVIDDCELFAQIEMIELATKKAKTVRLCSVE